MNELSTTSMSAQRKWQLAVTRYVAAINAYVAKGLAEGWDTCGEEPSMVSLDETLPAWRAALEAANAPGASAADRAAFRRDWPPAHAPLINLLPNEAIAISTLACLNDQSMLVRVGTWYEAGYVLHIVGERVERVSDVEFFGQCPAGRYLALANKDGVVLTDGWHGPQVARLAWPTGREDLPEGVAPAPFDAHPTPLQLIPFPDGKRVLLVSGEGVFVLAEDGTRRVYPTREELEQEEIAARDEAEGKDADEYPVSLAMAHGAISPDGRWIGVGSQSDRHWVFDADLQPVARVGPVSEYPHFALFSSESSMAIFNACHFYNGATLGVAVQDLPGLDTDYYADDPRTPTLQEGARVYAAVHRGDEFIIGDAGGYVRAFSHTGEQRWQQYVGSTVSAMAISMDGKTLIVATYAGFLCTFALDASGAEPWQIGTGAHREVQRWVFWKSWDRPMLW